MKYPILLLGLCALLSGCYSDQTKAAYGATVEVDRLPRDVCYVGGAPVNLALSVEDEGDLDLTYLNTNGDFVSQKYGTRGLTSFSTHQQGKLVWTRDPERPAPKCDP